MILIAIMVGSTATKSSSKSRSLIFCVAHPANPSSSKELSAILIFALLGGIIPLAIDRLRHRLGIRCWFNPGSFNNSARRCLRLLLDLLRSLCELLQLQLDVHHCNPVIEQS